MIVKVVKELLKKEVVNLTYQDKVQFLGRLFRVPKKDGNQRHMITLKQLNEFIPYHHFKMGVYIV